MVLDGGDDGKGIEPRCRLVGDDEIPGVAGQRRCQACRRFDALPLERVPLDAQPRNDQGAVKG
ncbi:MAG: hypothetical protein DI596_02155 [Azospira oryzae]|nr:MAG: hypothetical protein DI596_02155 [Azospira oryzae]PZP82316.1 MAG: hypothetical protein DI593_02155 [Azospira oryzae]